jgi:nucleoid-associated protein EbfC
MLDMKKYKKLSKDLQSGMESMQDELAKVEVEGVAGGGALRILANGNQEILKVEIKPEAVDPDDIEMLADLFRAAANQAMEKSKAIQQERINQLTGGMNLPNLPFL